jgi:flagellar hook protein FlgE
MGFQQGLSGLNMASKGLDVVGNNIANSQTVGFKGAQTQFNDIYASAILGAAGNAVGQGGAVMDVAQLFTQGNITVTNNPLDIAINGQGFLHFQPSLTDATPEYSRNGQMHANKDGYLVNAQDQFLCCYPSPDGKIIDSTRALPLQLPLGQLEPQQTGWSSVTNPGEGGVAIGANLDIRDTRALGATDPWTALTPWDFSNLSPEMYNYSTSTSVFDQAGIPHVMTMYFVRQGDSTTGSTQREWAPHYVLDNTYEIQEVADASVPASKVLAFDASGQLSSASASRFTLDFTNTFNSSGAGVSASAATLALNPAATTQAATIGNNVDAAAAAAKVSYDAANIWGAAQSPPVASVPLNATAVNAAVAGTLSSDPGLVAAIAAGDPAVLAAVAAANAAAAAITAAVGTLATAPDLTSIGSFSVVNLTSDTPPGVALFDSAIPMDFDFSRMTEFGSSYDVSSLTQDGYGPGMLSGLSIDKDGSLQGRYSNGQSKLIGQIPLTIFQNPNGLIPLGNNLWVASAESGEPLEGAPESGSRGSIQAGSVEEANVDLTAELVNMITMQRAYQANAQTIKTQDSILQTLVNLR